VLKRPSLVMYVTSPQIGSAIALVTTGALSGCFGTNATVFSRTVRNSKSTRDVLKHFPL